MEYSFFLIFLTKHMFSNDCFLAVSTMKYIYIYMEYSSSLFFKIPLTVGIWDSNRFADDLLGEVTLSVLDFMEMESENYGVLNSNRSVDWWPLTYSTKNGIVPAGEVRLQIEFFFFLLSLFLSISQ